MVNRPYQIVLQVLEILLKSLPRNGQLRDHGLHSFIVPTMASYRLSVMISVISTKGGVST
jgi:hypothetical protein